MNQDINKLSQYDFHIAQAGLGNRIASILRGMLDGVPVAWVGAHGFEWADFFSNEPPCEIVYFKNAKNLRNKYRVAEGHWAFPLNDTDRVVKELKSWRPSESVRERMLNIAPGTIAYKLRLLAPDRQLIDSFLVPEGCFLACDCQETIQKNSGHALVNTGGGMLFDADRSDDHWLYAVADWFMLMQCAFMVEVVPSTFTTAHKVCGTPFAMVKNPAELERVLALGTDIDKLKSYETSIEDKLSTFGWGQEFWGESEQTTSQLEQISKHLWKSQTLEKT